MRKVIAIGEMLIDFMPTTSGKSLREVVAFEKNAGGAPANVAVCISRLGGQSSFLGKFSDDEFGEYLLSVLIDEGVSTKDSIVSNEANTGLAFISLEDTGEREFLFYRSPSIDMLLNENEINESTFRSKDILHFCSVSLIDSPIKSAHRRAISIAKENNCQISFDPNIRFSLWPNKEYCRNVILEFIVYADILKLSLEELFFITDTTDKNLAIKKIQSINNSLSWLIITKGKDGVEAWVNNNEYAVEGFKVDTIDTTGAGDSFIGAILFCLSSDKIQDTLEILRFANAVAAITTTRLGAINALPYYNEVHKFLSDYKLNI